MGFLEDIRNYFFNDIKEDDNQDPGIISTSNSVENNNDTSTNIRYWKINKDSSFQWNSDINEKYPLTVKFGKEYIQLSRKTVNSLYTFLKLRLMEKSTGSLKEIGAKDTFI